MRGLAPLLMALGLVACATDGASDQTYTLGRGLVNYDAMARARSECAAAGGEVRPKGVRGEDPAQMSNYLCVIPKKGSNP